MEKLNTILSNPNLVMSGNPNNERRNWLTFARLSIDNPLMFRSLWMEFNAMEKAEARETVRLFWCREFENRQVYGHFLRVTE